MSIGGRTIGARVTVTAFGLTDPGKVRENNEDAFIIAPLAEAGAAVQSDQVMTLEAAKNAVLLGVSDGMGGASAGEVASAMVIESLHQALRDAKGDWDAATRQAVEHANQTVWAAASRNEGQKGMGATLTAVCIYGSHAHIAEVGDSRAYLLRQEAMLQLTRDQSYVQFLVEKGLLTTDGARTSPFKNVITQAMGIARDVTPVLTRVALRRGDRVLLCSDGLSNKVGDREMHRIIYWHRALSSACVNLIGAANQHGGDDNITVILFSADGDGVPDHAADAPPDEGVEVLGPFETPIAGNIPVS